MSRLPVGDFGPGQIARFNGIQFVGLNLGDGLSVEGNTLKVTAAGNGIVGKDGAKGEKGDTGPAGPTGPAGSPGSASGSDPILSWLNL